MLRTWRRAHKHCQGGKSSLALNPSGTTVLGDSNIFHRNSCGKIYLAYKYKDVNHGVCRDMYSYGLDSTSNCIHIYIYIKNPPIHASDSQLAFILIRVLNHHATYVQCQCHYRRVSIGTLEDGEIHLSNRQDVWDVPLKIPTSDGV